MFELILKIFFPAYSDQEKTLIMKTSSDNLVVRGLDFVAHQVLADLNLT